MYTIQDEAIDILKTHTGDADKAYKALQGLEETTRDQRKTLRTQWRKKWKEYQSDTNVTKEDKKEQMEAQKTKWKEYETRFNTLIKKYKKEDRTRLQQIVGKIVR